jgi:hypothetical protein
MKTKTKKEGKTLFIELKLKKFFKKLNKKGDLNLYVKTSKKMKQKELVFLIKQDLEATSEQEAKFVVFQEGLGMQTRPISKMKVVKSIQRIVRIVAKGHGFKTSFI